MPYQMPLINCPLTSNTVKLNTVNLNSIQRRQSNMIEPEGRRYYETRDLEELFGRTRPTIWAWRRHGLLPEALKPFETNGPCIWPVNQINDLDED